MTQKTVYWFILLINLAANTSYAASMVIQHEIEVSLSPEKQTLKVKDHIRLPENAPLEFKLHAGLDPRILTPGVLLTKIGAFTLGSPLQAYRVTLPEDVRDFTLEYGGKIAHQFRNRLESPGRSHQLLSGTISKNGVFLDAGVAWYPVFPDTLQNFQLTIDIPEDWLAVSQGAGPIEKRNQGKRTVIWRETHPQDDIYLIAAPFHFYSRKNQPVQAQVFLRKQDPALAKRYLDATEHYLSMYQELIGPYPYAKFALVENFWETGYGMPSFTLLGSRVIRLPFILHTSFPHEILHNWWGNGVYVDYPTGNWSEGLTAYLADHLLKEQQGKGINYRRSALQRFGDFVRSENDFPLTDFRSRHTTASQSVGYDKSLMLFHMLRRKLGDEQFIAGLQRFFKDNRFKTAGFTELQDAFEIVSSADLKDFFQQWTQRSGAPVLAVSDLKVEPRTKGFQLTGSLHQTQDSAPFQLDVPIIVYTEDSEQPIKQLLSIQSKTQEFSIDLPSRPLRLDIDPWFDLFRQLHVDEAPPTFGKLFGAEKILFVIPSDVSESQFEAYKRMAAQWSKGYPDVSTVLDSDLELLPAEGNIWLLGWENRLLENLLKEYSIPQFAQQQGRFELAGESYQKNQDSLVFVNQGNESSDQIVGVIASHSAKAINGLTRKIPHYGKYSYLVFSGETPNNRLKGQWKVTESPLRINFSDNGMPFEALKPEPLWPASKTETKSKKDG
ncbi:MAG: M1 family aminopeptidase [Pseudomonadota bacterium]